jgi:hypothetical protein
MKLRVTVLSDVQQNANGSRYQIMAVHYPGAMVPVEKQLWLGKQGEARAKGEYVVDLTVALKPDARNFNEPRIDFRGMVPNAAAKG